MNNRLAGLKAAAIARSRSTERSRPRHILSWADEEAPFELVSSEEGAAAADEDSPRTQRDIVDKRLDTLSDSLQSLLQRLDKFFEELEDTKRAQEQRATQTDAKINEITDIMVRLAVRRRAASPELPPPPPRRSVSFENLPEVTRERFAGMDPPRAHRRATNCRN